MATIEKALRIAARAHEGQVDKQGLPYIFHPLRVMDGVEGLQTKIVAVLHDVVEDTPMTLDDLEREGFTNDVLAAIQCVTHAEGDSYAEYVIRCKANPIAIQVKLADLADNSRPERSLVRANAIDRDLARNARYVLSRAFLTGQIDEARYRTAMTTFEH